SEDDSLQQGRRPTARVLRPQPRTLLKNAVDLVPQALVDDGLVLAGIGRAFVDGFAEIDAAVDELVYEALVDRLAALDPYAVSRPMLVVVLNDGVTDTKVTLLRSKMSTSLAKSISERDNRTIL